MPICNHFHERLANNGKITTFAGVPLFDALMCDGQTDRQINRQIDRTAMAKMH